MIEIQWQKNNDLNKLSLPFYLNCNFPTVMWCVCDCHGSVETLHQYH